MYLKKDKNKYKKGFTSRKSFCRSGPQTLIFGGREVTTGNASAVRRLGNEPFTR